VGREENLEDDVQEVPVRLDSGRIGGEFSRRGVAA